MLVGFGKLNLKVYMGIAWPIRDADLTALCHRITHLKIRGLQVVIVRECDCKSLPNRDWYLQCLENDRNPTRKTLRVTLPDVLA